MAEMLTPDCPLCSQPPVSVLEGGVQAFCGTVSCPVWTWDPSVSRADNLRDIGIVQLPPMEGDGVDERLSADADSRT